MPYDVSWFDEAHTILQVDIYGKITWDAFYETIDEVCAQLATVSHCAYVIFVDQVGLPNGNPLPPLMKTTRQLNQQPNLGLVFIVADQSVILQVKLASEVVAIPLSFEGSRLGGYVDSVEEAIRQIEADKEKNTVCG